MLGIFINLSKVFDTVGHVILLKRIKTLRYTRQQFETVLGLTIN